MTAPVAPPVPPAVSGSGPEPTPSPRPDRGPLVQRVLLAAGALCVLVAAAVYLAVSWERIGTTGQAGAALVVTAVAALSAHLLARRELQASAETLALVASGLLALDLAGAHHLDVLGAARLPWWSWLTLAGGVVLLTTVGLALLTRLVAYRVVAVAALATVPFTGAVALDRAGVAVSAAALSTAAVAVAAGLVALAVRIGRRDPVTALVASGGALGWWCLAGASGIAAAASADRLTAVVPAGVLWTLAGLGLLEATGRALAHGRAGDARIVVSVAAPLAALPALLVVPTAVAAFGPVAVIVAAALLAAVPALSRSGRAVGRPLALAVPAVLVVLTGAALVRVGGFDLAGVVVSLTAVAAAGLALRTSGAGRVAAGLGAVGAAVLGLALLAVERAEPALVLTASWTALAVALLAAGTFVRRDGTLVAGGVVAGLAGLAGFAAQALDTRSPALVVALLGVGAAVVLHGVVRVSRTALLLGAGLVAGAALDLAAVARVSAVEAYTLPVAAVLLLAGGLGRVGRPELSSWAWAAPALLVAAVPSTVVALTDPGVARLVIVAAAAATVLVAGLAARLAAPLLIGAATEAALAVSQLAPYAVGAPRWVTLALAGVLLLTLGVLFERARHGAVVAGRWCAALR